MPQDGVFAANLIGDRQGIKLRKVKVCHSVTANADDVVVRLNDWVEWRRLLQGRKARGDAAPFERIQCRVERCMRARRMRTIDFPVQPLRNGMGCNSS